MNDIAINIAQCEKIGNTLSKYSVRKHFFDRPFLKLTGTREEKMLVYLFSAAICHQTYSLFHQKRNLYGWDFMEYAFVKAFNSNSKILDIEFLSLTTIPEIKNELIAIFSNDETPALCTLDRLDERAKMLKQLSQGILRHPSKSIFGFLGVKENKSINITSLYNILKNFQAFEDPLRKKITFFVKLASDAKMFHIIDQQNIIPIMDYHMQRVLLRLGCINVNDKKLKTSLINRRAIKSDQEIRETCIEAIKIISKNSGHSILSMNDYFWPLGRSCCNEHPLCQHQKCEKEPCTLFLMVEIKDHSKCIFQEVCKGAIDKNFRNFWQPVVETHYY